MSLSLCIGMKNVECLVVRWPSPQTRISYSIKTTNGRRESAQYPAAWTLTSPYYRVFNASFDVGSVGAV